MHIVQIVPTMGRGGGISGVAWHLHRQFVEMGHTAETLTEGDLGRRHPVPRSLTAQRLRRLVTAVSFSLRGGMRARRHLAQHPSAVSICHNAALAGDVYVNHGVVSETMRARGHMLWRMLRNPLHVFTYLRDRYRYRGRTHRAVVALCDSEVEVLRRTYGRVRPPVHVIGHGVDLEEHRPPTPVEREAARARLALDEEHRVALFIGHELDRKGVALLIDALVDAPTVMLLVVGGYRSAVNRMTARAIDRGVAERVLFAGPQVDLAPWFAAADMFAFPSAYESYGLVITEALASGIPVIATRVGVAPEVIVDGHNGYLVDPEPRQIADRLESVAATEVAQWRQACRDSVIHLTWRATAERYLQLLGELATQRGGARS
ncbi:glycosyltransferase [Microbacterium sp.]|uniref:glycosyltransferase n=1 Tax=Microbacterium sp. TaxID=51671 RepID=UPI002810CECA|nr:glycosyltransferase [Microbacterium sp.]